ncbi:MAG: trimeric intracellular cation channel family protein [Rhodocyclaceae bacterium]|nr:trimeric intracellular cation channel family protein [Rhodocyclaceae bacterium]
MVDFIYWVGMAAVAVNALTGVLEAERKEVDIIGASFVAVATALGGGTVRDLLLDRKVFWVVDQTYLITAVAVGIASFFLIRHRTVSPRWFLFPDAVGLALFTVIGTQVALQWHTPWLAASLMGVITGVFGGVVRDVLCNEVPLVMRAGELYATAAWLGALLLIGLQLAGVPEVWASGATMVFILALRMAAIRFHLTLPSFSVGRDE